VETVEAMALPTLAVLMPWQGFTENEHSKVQIP